MINWIPLEELLLCPIRNGLTKPKAIRDKGVKMIAMGEIFSKARINNMDMDRVPVTDKELENCRIQEGDLLFARQSLVLGGAGKCSIVADVKEPTVFESHLIRVRIDATKANPYYVFYYFNSTHGRDSIGTIVEQVAAAGIRGSDLIKLKVPCPDVQTQNKIAEFLQRIDEKIELNTDINNNLYQILAASYKHDYLDSIMTDYQEVTLDDITSKIATGLNPRKNFVLGQGSNYYVTIKNMGDNRIYLDEKCDSIDDDALIKINKRSDLAVGDCLFSGIGTIGRVHLIDTPPTNWNISESVFTLRAATLVSSEFLYLLLLSDDMQGYANALASGSAQKGIRMADLKKYPVFLPNSERMAQLTSYWRPLIQEIKNNERESDQLASIRSSLLPKLLTGDIDVSEVEI